MSINLIWESQIALLTGTSIRVNAYAGRILVGYCISLVSSDSKDLCIEVLEVKKQYQKKGIGRILMREMIKSGHYLRIHIIACPYGPHPRISSEDLVRFYETFGFERKFSAADSVSLILVNK
jgi:GNAT superfamily N-acetyltransferase